jgi:hypothetical protein
MRQAEIDKRNRLIDYAKRFGCKVFVETGTYKGDTVKAMLLSGLFDKIYSMDIFEDRAVHAQNRFKSFPTVDCRFGDSAVVLPEILTEIHEPALFWLDAHHSGKQIARTKGLVETPIAAELDAVLNHPQAADHVLLIDDARYYEEFSKQYDNYPTTQALKDKILGKFPDWVFEVKDDIIRAHR